MEQQPTQTNAPANEAVQTEKKPEHSSIFRQKSIDRISSPEQLNDYLRVASPRIWVVLAAVVIFLAGFIAWSVFGRVRSRVNGVAIVDKGVCTVYVSQKRASLLKAGNPVKIKDVEATVTSVSPIPFTLPDVFPEYAISVGGFTGGEWICSAVVDNVNLPNGIYDASVVVETIKPISFLTEKNVNG